MCFSLPSSISLLPHLALFRCLVVSGISGLAWLCLDSAATMSKGRVRQKLDRRVVAETNCYAEERTGKRQATLWGPLFWWVPRSQERVLSVISWRCCFTSVLLYCLSVLLICISLLFRYPTVSWYKSVRFCSEDRLSCLFCFFVFFLLKAASRYTFCLAIWLCAVTVPLHFFLLRDILALLPANNMLMAIWTRPVTDSLVTYSVYNMSFISSSPLLFFHHSSTDFIPSINFPQMAKSQAEFNTNVQPTFGSLSNAWSHVQTSSELIITGQTCYG